MRIVIAEDSVLLREGIARLLAEYDHEVVDALGDATRLLSSVQEHAPDLVIVDVRMPPTHTDEGLRLLAPILLRARIAMRRRALNDHRGLRRGFLPRGLSDTCPQSGADRQPAAHAGRCPTTLNTSRRSTRCRIADGRAGDAELQSNRRSLRLEKCSYPDVI